MAKMISGVGLEGWAICQDEHCRWEGLHAPHEVRRPDREPKPTRPHKRTVLEAQPSGWQGPIEAPQFDGLSEAIYRAVKSHEIRVYRQIASTVENTYGSCEPRTVYRRLKHLINDGYVVKMEFIPNSLYAYVRSDSPLLKAPMDLWEQALTADSLGAALS